MKKHFCICVVLVVIAFFPAFGEALQLGGIIESYGTTICSLDARKTFDSLTIEFAPAFMTYSLSNPSITISGTSSSSGTTTSGSTTTSTATISAVLLQFGGYYNWWKPENMVVYSGMRLGVGILSGSAVYNNTSYDLSGNVIDVKLVALGWDWKFPGLSNLLFSSSMGIQSIFFPSIEGTMNTTEIVINPGLSSCSTFLELGTRISLGNN